MIFLNTNGSMNLMESEVYTTVDFILEDYMLDLSLSEFTKLVYERLSKVYFAYDTPTLFRVISEGIEAEDVEYVLPFLTELMTESLRVEKVNKDWQPRPAISNRLNLNIKAQNNLLNYKTNPEILTIKIYNNDELIYDMIKEE